MQVRSRGIGARDVGEKASPHTQPETSIQGLREPCAADKRPITKAIPGVAQIRWSGSRRHGPQDTWFCVEACRLGVSHPIRRSESARCLGPGGGRGVRFGPRGPAAGPPGRQLRTGAPPAAARLAGRPPPSRKPPAGPAPAGRTAQQAAGCAGRRDARGTTRLTTFQDVSGQKLTQLPRDGVHTISRGAQMQPPHCRERNLPEADPD